MKSFVRALQDLALLVVRIATGAILMLHGWTRWEQTIPKVTQQLTDLHVPWPNVFAWGTVGFELIGGALLVFGLLTPLIGLVLVVMQVMIICYAKWRLGPFLVDGGYEYNVALAALGLLFATHGGGRTAVDALFRRSDKDHERFIVDDNAPA